MVSLYRPFEATPDDWQACKGSEPHLRGYPCSLWTLFHTLLANAALEGDPSMAYGGKAVSLLSGSFFPSILISGQSMVARTMVGYIHHFFSCRHCAANFKMKVQTLGFLPNTRKDSILWLWQVHNMANEKLKGRRRYTVHSGHTKILFQNFRRFD